MWEQYTPPCRLGSFCRDVAWKGPEPGELHKWYNPSLLLTFFLLAQELEAVRLMPLSVGSSETSSLSGLLENRFWMWSPHPSLWKQGQGRVTVKEK